MNKLLTGVCCFVLGFLFNKFMPPKNATLSLVNTGLTLILIGIGFVLIFQAISAPKKQENVSKKIGEQVLKTWSIEELFSFLEKEKELIDLVIENEGMLHIGITTYHEYRPFSKNVPKKYYYIEEVDYDDFDSFKSAFLTVFKNENVIIYYAGIEDMVVKI